jgi:hypothetical protein
MPFSAKRVMLHYIRALEDRLDLRREIRLAALQLYKARWLTKSILGVDVGNEVVNTFLTSKALFLVVILAKSRTSPSSLSIY